MTNESPYDRLIKSINKRWRKYLYILVLVSFVDSAIRHFSEKTFPWIVMSILWMLMAWFYEKRLIEYYYSRKD